MGKKNKYNFKAINVPQIEIDDSTTKQIKLDIKHRQEGFDDCNALVLPSAKRKTINKKKALQVTRLLSKKKRKQLEKVIEKRKKKQNRAELVEELSKVKVSEEELKQYVTLTSIQTKGLKRHFKEVELESTSDPLNRNKNAETDAEVVVNALKGAKRGRLAALQCHIDQSIIKDPNVLDINETSSESESNEEYEKEIVKNNEDLKKNISDDNEKKFESINKIDKEQSVTPESKKKFDNENSEKKTLENINDKKKIQTFRVVDKIPAVFIALDRKPEIQEARLKLPILAEEQRVVEAINDNLVVIITGETGSGKTTQVPQFLYEAGYAEKKMIGITEPRRVAAYSMSKRVGEEMNLSSEKVSYLIRFEGNVTPKTKIKFMTDGVLLKEIQTDFLLKSYSVIILDEAHERSVYTDILIGLLTRIALLRNKKNDPLKLIIMSATLRVQDFIDNPKLFKIKPPVINVESRQFPVTVHFNKTTSANYVNEAIRKTVKIHTQLPDGGILVFLTGQKEVNTVVKKLRKAFPYRKKKLSKNSNEKDTKNSKKLEDKSNESDENSEDEFYLKGSKSKAAKFEKSAELPKIDLDMYSAQPPDDAQDDLIDTDNFLAEGEDNEFEEDEELGDDVINLKDASNFQPLWVLPLYSLLSSEKQAKVFQPVPEGCRLCVIATNVAETSLTIPNIKYVVDSGKCKTKMYDKVTGVTTFVVTFTSKAAANQRAGRAGRTSAGHCYRLYSSAVFNDQFPEYTEPEICQKPVDDLILQMKIMNIDKVVNFPFPTPPGEKQLKTAEKRLCLLGALEQPNLNQKVKELYCTKVTELGKAIAAFPVASCYGKMLALSQQHDLLPYTICMVAALSVPELLVESFGQDEQVQTKWAKSRRRWAGVGNSFLLGDPMVLIGLVGACEYAASRGRLSEFCKDNGLREKAMIEIRKLRQQLTNEILLNVPNLSLSIDPKMAPPTDIQSKLLRQIILAGKVHQVAHKLSPDEIQDNENKKKWKYAYKTLEMEEPVFMDSLSILRKERPEWVTYQEVYETNKIYIRGITAIEPSWLPKFVPNLCNLSEPLTDPSPSYDPETGKVMCYRTGTFGLGGWELPTIEVEYPKDIEGIKWFTRFLLEGEIFPKLKKFVPSLLSSPSSVTKSWAKLLPRIEMITKTLLSKGIMTKDKLSEEWKLDSNFLLSAYKKWLPESAHSQAVLIWPPL